MCEIVVSVLIKFKCELLENVIFFGIIINVVVEVGEVRSVFIGSGDILVLEIY